MSDNAECARCEVTAADFPYEDLGMTLTEASEFLFEHDRDEVLCRGCGPAAPPGTRLTAQPVDDLDDDDARLLTQDGY